VFGRWIINAVVITGAFVNAVPDRAELHPIKFIHDPIEDDLMGSGFEVERVPVARAARREAPDQRIAETWRRLAKQLRWLASFSEGGGGKDLLARADEYEARAEQLEDRGEV
jgi:hypothetical protein